MTENKTFQTLAEAIEAGEPPIIDKVIGGVKERVSFWVDIQGETQILESAYKTLSGKYIIIARPRTNEEKEAEKNANKQEKAAQEKERRERIEALMAIPGYILIAWTNPLQPNGKFSHFFYPDIFALYLPETGARYVYQKHYKIIWLKDNRGIDSKMTIETPGKGWTRWNRRDIAETLKTRPDEFILCAPRWLLTSIPDPRPRYLHPENENEGEGEITAAGV